MDCSLPCLMVGVGRYIARAIKKIAADHFLQVGLGRYIAKASAAGTKLSHRELPLASSVKLVKRVLQLPHLFTLHTPAWRAGVSGRPRGLQRVGMWIVMGERTASSGIVGGLRLVIARAACMSARQRRLGRRSHSMLPVACPPFHSTDFPSEKCANEEE